MSLSAEVRDLLGRHQQRHHGLLPAWWRRSGLGRRREPEFVGCVDFGLVAVGMAIGFIVSYPDVAVWTLLIALVLLTIGLQALGLAPAIHA